MDPIHADIHFGSREQMNLLWKNIFQNVKKFETEIRMYIQTNYVHTQIFGKKKNI
jgi:hypothetical protein